MQQLNNLLFLIAHGRFEQLVILCYQILLIVFLYTFLNHIWRWLLILILLEPLHAELASILRELVDRFERGVWTEVLRLPVIDLQLLDQ